jgi:hypothetical protein
LYHYTEVLVRVERMLGSVAVAKAASDMTAGLQGSGSSVTGGVFLTDENVSWLLLVTVGLYELNPVDP